MMVEYKEVCTVPAIGQQESFLKDFNHGGYWGTSMDGLDKVRKEH